MTEQQADITNSTLTAALAAAQAEIKSAKFNRTNPHFKNKYADLASLREAYQGPFARHGLALVQIIEPTEDGMMLITRIAHKSGEHIESKFPIRFSPAETMQSIGSKLTYARRYSVAAMVAIGSEEDDDGEAERTEKTKRPQATMEAPTLDLNGSTLSSDEVDEIEEYLQGDEGLRFRIIDGYRKMYDDRKILGLSDIPRKHFAGIIERLTKRPAKPN